MEAVRRYSAGSADLIQRIEGRRAIVSGETLALRKRAYGAQLLLDELEFVLATGRTLGLNWSTVRDIGSTLARSIFAEVRSEESSVRKEGGSSGRSRWGPIH